MHEMALAESVLRTIEDAVDGQDVRGVVAVALEIGELAAVDAEALTTCLDVVLRGSIAERARIDIVSVAGRGVCSGCAATQAMPEIPMLCDACGAPLRVSGGDRMRVIDLEVN